jgi:hypothetical protein
MTAPTDEALARLSIILRNINLLADSGEWDDLQALAAEFNQAADLLAPDTARGNLARQQLQDLLVLNEQTLLRCQARLKDIAPLLSALRTAKSS